MTRKRSLSDASTSSNNITVQQKLQKIILCTLTNNITKKNYKYSQTVKQIDAQYNCENSHAEAKGFDGASVPTQ